MEKKLINDKVVNCEEYNNSMKYSGIYIIISKINLKFYIGSAANIVHRKNSHYNSLKNNKHYNSYLQRTYNKYDINNLEFYILEKVENKENLLNREQYWIDYLEAIKYGYNLQPTAGSALGRKRSKEECQQISERQKDGKAHRLGKKNTKETRHKISIALKGRIFTDKHLNKLSMSAKKPILQYSLDGDFIKEWDCAKTASIEGGFHAGHISSCCKNKLKYHKGYVWKYRDSNI